MTDIIVTLALTRANTFDRSITFSIMARLMRVVQWSKLTHEAELGISFHIRGKVSLLIKGQGMAQASNPSLLMEDYIFKGVVR